MREVMVVNIGAMATGSMATKKVTNEARKRESTLAHYIFAVIPGLGEAENPEPRGWSSAVRVPLGSGSRSARPE